MSKITREEFIARFCMNRTKEFFHENFLALPCQCDGMSCKGWAAIDKSALTVRAHMDLYLPPNGRELIAPEDLPIVDALLEEAARIIEKS